MNRRLVILVAGVLAALALAQLALPLLAERWIRGELEDVGVVESVAVDALPAVKLVWRRADSVTIRMRESTAGSVELADLLARTRGARRVDATVEALRVGPLTLRDVRLRKSGDRLRAQTFVSDADLRAAAPAGFQVRPVASEDGRLVFQGSVTVLGATVSAQAALVARGGRLLLAPVVPFGGLLTLTLFADPRVSVEDVGARTRPGGFALTVRARLV